MLAGPTKLWARFTIPVFPYRAITLIFGHRALKSIARLSMQSHTPNQLVSVARCRSQQSSAQATINLTRPAEFHGTIPLGCGASSILDEFGECSPDRIQGMEDCSCTRSRLYNCHETIRNHPFDCTCMPLVGHHRRRFSDLFHPRNFLNSSKRLGMAWQHLF